MSVLQKIFVKNMCLLSYFEIHQFACCDWIFKMVFYWVEGHDTSCNHVRPSARNQQINSDFTHANNRNHHRKLVIRIRRN